MLSCTKIKKLIEETLAGKITQHYLNKDKLEYIEITTGEQQQTNILIEINKQYSVETNDIRKSMISTIHEHEFSGSENTSYILSENNINGIVKELDLKDWPEGYIDLVLQFQKSLAPTDYKSAIVVSDFLIVPNDVGSCRVFKKNKHSETKLLMLVDLQTLVKKNSIKEIEKIYRNLMQILIKDNGDYLKQLSVLMKQCQSKIFVNRAPSCPIDQNVKISQSHKALKSALDCFETK